MDPPTELGRSERLFDSFAADLIENPYPHYDRVRSVEPIYWEPVHGLWVLTRYDYVSQVLNNEMFEVGSLSERIAHFGRRTQRDYTPLIKAAERKLEGRVVRVRPMKELE